jgi:hypothetical protein
LWSRSWKDFADSIERQRRLSILTNIAHEWGLIVGITTPYIFQQQHSWMLIREPNENFEIEMLQMKKNIDYV